MRGTPIPFNLFTNPHHRRSVERTAFADPAQPIRLRSRKVTLPWVLDPAGETAVPVALLSWILFGGGALILLLVLGLFFPRFHVCNVPLQLEDWNLVSGSAVWGGMQGVWTTRSHRRRLQ